MKGKLEPRQRLFVKEYLVDRNQSQAYIRAGYSDIDANVNASKLMAKTHIKKAIRVGLRQQEKRLDITADKVILLLWDIANLNLKEAYDDEGKLKNIHDMPDRVAKAISGMETEELYDGYGQDKQYLGETKKLKTWDKLKAAELIGRHFKMFTDKLEIESKVSLASAMKEARERVKKRTHSK